MSSNSNGAASINSTGGTINGGWKMIPVKTLMYDIYEMLPDAELAEEDRIEELLFQGASKLYKHKYYERATCLRLVSEHRASLPGDYVGIRSVLGKAYNCNNMSSTDVESDATNTSNTILQLVNGVTEPSTNSSTVNIDYNYTIDLKESETIKKLTNRSSINWKYLHPGTSIIHQLKEQIDIKKAAGCFNEDGSNINMEYCEQCDHLYSIDTLGRLVTTMHTGLVLVEYLRLPKDPEGNLLIPYHHDLQDALNAYVFYKYFVKLFNEGRQGALQKMQYWQQQWQFYYINVKNAYLMPSLSEQLHAIQNRDMWGSKGPMSMYTDYVMNPTIKF